MKKYFIPFLTIAFCGFLFGMQKENTGLEQQQTKTSRDESRAVYDKKLRELEERFCRSQYPEQQILSSQLPLQQNAQREVLLQKLEALKNKPYESQLFNPACCSMLQPLTPPQYAGLLFEQIKGGKNINDAVMLSSDCGWYPLIFDVAEHDDCHELLEVMLEYGADPNKQSMYSKRNFLYRETVLGRAIRCMETRNAQLLLERGAEPSLSEDQRIICWNPDTNSKIALLISRGAKLEDVWGGRPHGMP